MESFRQFDVVKVPFPFSEKRAQKRRPALIVSQPRSFDSKIQHSVLAMITTKSHASWPLDIAISHLDEAGLSFPSLIRFKMFTLDQRLILARLGHLHLQDRQAAREALKKLFQLK